MIERTTFSRVIFNIINYGVLIGLCIVCIAPLLHVIMASISDPRMLMSSKGLMWKPVGKVTLRGYELVFNNSSIIKGYINTLFYVSATTLFGTLMTIAGGYVLSRNNMKLKTPLTLLVIFTMMFSGGLIPGYMLIKSLGILNSAAAIIIPGATNAFFIIIMKSAFEQLSPEYEESAKIDGAGPVKIMFRILVPLIKPTVAVVIMFIVVMQWNSWFPASIYLPKRRDLWPLQLVMREILVQNDTAKILSGSDAVAKSDMVSNLVKYCVIIIGTLPILCAYPFAQKYFVKGVTLGGVKG